MVYKGISQKNVKKEKVKITRVCSLSIMIYTDRLLSPTLKFWKVIDKPHLQVKSLILSLSPWNKQAAVKFLSIDNEYISLWDVPIVQRRMFLVVIMLTITLVFHVLIHIFYILHEIETHWQCKKEQSQQFLSFHFLLHHYSSFYSTLYCCYLRKWVK